MTHTRPLIMAPGVQFTETDISQYIKSLAYTIFADLGGASKGVLNQPVLLTSLDQAVATFGPPKEDYPGLLALREFFNAGGGIAYFTRVANGDTTASVDVDDIGSSDMTFSALSSGSDGNNIALQISNGGAKALTEVTASHTFSNIASPTTAPVITHGGTPGSSTQTYVVAAYASGALISVSSAGTTTSGNATLNGTNYNTITWSAVAGADLYKIYRTVATTPSTLGKIGQTSATTIDDTGLSGDAAATPTNPNVYTTTLNAQLPLVPGTIKLKFGTTLVATDNGNSAFTFTSAYNHYTGTINYQTGVVTITATGLSAIYTASMKFNGNYWTQFNVQVRYTSYDNDGNVVRTTNVESWPGMTIDTVVETLANSTFITIDAAPATFPVPGLYPLTGGDDGIDDLTDADYIGSIVNGVPTGLQVYAFPDQIDINVVSIPGISSQAVREAVQQLVEVQRADTLAILDPPADLSEQGVADWANATGNYSSWNVLDSTYMAINFPWYTSYNSVNNANEVTPPSAWSIAALAQSQPYQAPAGPNRGRITNVIDVAYKLNATDRLYLGNERINPIANLHGMGIMLLGQQTATKSPSSLDRIASRVMLMRIEKAVTTAMFPLLFEPNTAPTWNRAVHIIQPFLDYLKANGQIYDGKFFCDGNTNSIQTINNNQMTAQCVLQLLKFAEIIVVNFVITNLGASITENITNSSPSS